MNGTLHARPLAGAILLAGLAFAFLAPPQAQAEHGRVRIGLTSFVHYRHLDFSHPQDRLALLTQIEAAAEEYCDVPLPRTSRQACARKTIDQTLKDAPDAVRRALALARLERDGAAHATR